MGCQNCSNWMAISFTSTKNVIRIKIDTLHGTVQLCIVCFVGHIRYIAPTMMLINGKECQKRQVLFACIPLKGTKNVWRKNRKHVKMKQSLIARSIVTWFYSLELMQNDAWTAIAAAMKMMLAMRYRPERLYLRQCDGIQSRARRNSVFGK